MIRHSLACLRRLMALPLLEIGLCGLKIVASLAWEVLCSGNSFSHSFDWEKGMVWNFSCGYWEHPRMPLLRSGTVSWAFAASAAYWMTLGAGSGFIVGGGFSIKLPKERGRAFLKRASKPCLVRSRERIRKRMLKRALTQTCVQFI